MSETAKRNLEWIDGSPLMGALGTGDFAAVIRGARALRAEGCIGAFHLELLGQIARRDADSLSDAKRLVGTLTLRDLYNRAPELLEVRDLWLEAASWFLHHELRREHSVSSGERIEALILGELGLVRTHSAPEETAAFKALALIKEGDLEGAFDQLFEAPAEQPSQPRGSVFRRAGHTLFQAVPRPQRLDVLRYKRGKAPVSYGLAPFPGHGFLIKEYVGTTQTGSSLLGKNVATLSPILTAGWIEGWKASDGFPENEDFARVERLLTGFSRA